MPAPQKIIELVEKFDLHKSRYLSPSYNETQLRIEFLNPLFEALGWDVDNKQGLDERYKDVIHEDAVRIGGTTKAPDYSFRIGGIRKFFVEAKKPSVNLKEMPEPAYQLRRYAWSAKLPVSILTDFEEFIIYDCTAKPSPGDKASVRRIAYFTYHDLVGKWDEIDGIFSPLSIKRGNFDKYTEKLVQKKGGKGTADIDDAFLAEIEGWRSMLAQNIALRNTTLSVRELNLAVQKIIDRVIFLRICEDRGIEEYERFRRLAEGKEIYGRLKDIFVDADAKYNSGLFHFEDEGNGEEPDRLTLTLQIDDKVLKQIISHLYYPESPYEFSVMPAEILGQVYEQFLGKVIRLTEGHHAKVDPKPEVKKAGGVYYTPTYIVNYIVSQTVGPLTDGKTPKEIDELRILDPACGSGSFLIGAYQFLLDWHLQWYMDHLVPLLEAGKTTTDKAVVAMLPERQVTVRKGKGRRKFTIGSEHPLPIYQVTETDWRLTTDEKKRILVNNIYGVDIDPQAVEVTKLSLLLKVLEGEKSERITKQLTITHERVLPSLYHNIKCGNSLIGPDIYADVQMTLDDEEVYRINAFDWNREFADIIQRGGFDAVIGNPPYVRQELLKGQKEYFQQHYAVYQGTADLYAYFIEKGISLLRPGGQFSYIVANKWMRANYGKPLRQWLKEKHIEEIVDFGDLPVFVRATTYPCILRVASGPTADSFNAVTMDTLDFQDLREYVEGHTFTVRQNDLEDAGWSLVDEQSQQLLIKIQKIGIPLGKFVKGKIFRGILTGFNTAFVINSEKRQSLINEDPNCAEIIKPFAIGKEIKRYSPIKANQSLLFIPWHFPLQDNHSIEGASKIAENAFKKQYPVVYEHLTQYKDGLLNRNKVETGVRYEWYALQRYGSNYWQEFRKPKIIYPEICKGPEFTYDDTGLFTNNKCFSIIQGDSYLLGILNSQLNSFYFNMVLPKLRGGFFMPASVIFKNFPIRTIDPTNPADVARHDRMVALVEKMLDLNKRLAEARDGHDKMVLQRQIEATDALIDRLVYELYGLSDEEIAIVEGNA